MKPQREPGEGTGGRSGAPGLQGHRAGSQAQISRVPQLPTQPLERWDKIQCSAVAQSCLLLLLLSGEEGSVSPATRSKATELRKNNQHSRKCLCQAGGPTTSPRGDSSSWRPKGNGTSFLESFQQSSSAVGGAQTAPATREGDKGQGRAAGGDTESSPCPVPAARGQGIPRDEAQGWRQSCSGMVLHSLSHPPSRGTFGDVSAATTAAAICSQCWPWLLTGPHWQSGPG